MWRAFFFATGTSLILLGAQCLVVDQYQIVDKTRVPSFVSKILDKVSTPDSSVQSPPMLQAGFPSQIQPGQFQPGQLQPGQFQPGQAVARNPSPFSLPSSNGSRFGPSRFDSSSMGNGNFGSSGFPTGGSGQFYGGVPSSRNNPQFSLSGFGNSPRSGSQISPAQIQFQPNGQGVGPRVSSNPLISGRLIQTKEWMPWSLLAAGTLVVLYTKSTRRYNGE
jgi:hypothetical protein